MDALKEYFKNHPMLPWAIEVHRTAHFPDDYPLKFRPQRVISRRVATVMISTTPASEKSAELTYNDHKMYVPGASAGCSAYIIYRRNSQRVTRVTLRTGAHTLVIAFAKDSSLAYWEMYAAKTGKNLGDYIRVGDRGQTIRVSQYDDDHKPHGVHTLRLNCQRPDEWLKTRSFADMLKYNGQLREYSEFVHGVLRRSVTADSEVMTSETDAAGRIRREVHHTSHTTIQYTYDGDNTTPAITCVMIAPNRDNGFHHVLMVSTGVTTRKFVDGVLKFIKDEGEPYAPVDEDGLRHGDVSDGSVIWTWTHGQLTRKVFYNNGLRETMLSENHYFPDGSFRKTDHKNNTITHYLADGVTKHGHEITNADGKWSYAPITCKIWVNGVLAETRYMDIDHNLLEPGTENLYTNGRLHLVRVGDVTHHYTDGYLTSSYKTLSKGHPYVRVETIYPAGTKTPSLANAVVKTYGDTFGQRSDVVHDSAGQPVRRVDFAVSEHSCLITITDKRLGLVNSSFQVCHEPQQFAAYCSAVHNGFAYEMYPPGLEYVLQGKTEYYVIVRKLGNRLHCRREVTPELHELVASLRKTNTTTPNNDTVEACINVMLYMVKTFTPVETRPTHSRQHNHYHNNHHRNHRNNNKAAQPANL